MKNDNPLESKLSKIAAQWKVSRVAVVFDDGRHDDHRWTIEGQCVADGHPQPEWKVGQRYQIGNGATRAEAISMALDMMGP